MTIHTWRKLITSQMETRKESWDNVIHYALGPNKSWWSEEDEESKEPALDEPFDTDFGGTEGCWFTLWTERYVYFPVKYDGAEWVCSVPRNPNDEATAHVGGG